MFDKNAYQIFSTHLYLEHLEEASFLYEQRLGLFSDPELNWQEIGDFENRFEPHIDALVLGEELALAVCQKRALEGDFGELHSAVCVFCRVDKFDLFYDVIKEIDPKEENVCDAVGNALCHELPKSWIQNISDFNKYESLHNFRGAIARAIGYKRVVELSDFVISMIEKEQDESVYETLVWTTGQLKIKSATDQLIRIYSEHKNTAIRKAALLACLKTAPLRAKSLLLESCEANVPYLGHIEDKSVGQKLLMLLKMPNEEIILAAGISGYTEAIPILLNHLGNKEVAQKTALALYLITGAPLIEKFFCPEEINEDELFDEEKEKLAKGEPIYENGKEPGITIERISQNKERWQQWLKENGEKFQPGIKIRLGKQLSKESAIDSLLERHIPCRVRQMLYDSLSIHYEIDIPFEYDMTVQEQIKQINKMKAER